MNSQRKIYGRAALLMAGIALASAVLTHFTGTVDTTRRGKTVVTTVYPLYVAAQNVLGDIPGITLVNLTGSATGCLHDYQLSPANRITLGSADLLLLNGAGAESFLEDVLPTLSATAVDTSAGLPLLDGDGHDHDHDHAHSHATEEDHDEGHAHADNEHVWVSPTRYAAQVQAITDALCTMDPANAAAYTANGAAYRTQVLAVADELQQLAAALDSRSCITFHESLAYLADDLGLHTAVSLTIGEDSGVSAGDLAAAQQAIKADGRLLLLYDNQDTVRYTALDRQVPAAQVLALNTAVKGSGHPDDWLRAMQHNITLLRQVTEG